MKNSDLHLVVNTRSDLIKAYVPGEPDPRWILPCHDEAVRGPARDVWAGNTPLGLWQCGDPIWTHPDEPAWIKLAFGYWFIPLWDVDGQARKHGRSGIGLHGGGSSLPDPTAPYQGWAKTHGCLRMQNSDLERCIQSVLYTQKKGGVVWLTTA